MKDCDIVAAENRIIYNISKPQKFKGSELFKPKYIAPENNLP